MCIIRSVCVLLEVYVCIIRSVRLEQCFNDIIIRASINVMAIEIQRTYVHSTD